ncbi:MAG: HAD-IC family P-type ATPase [Actinobacteria bacterium]|nr:HAD-IC family P-type ATPase [Actinomycetota bacterium]
MADVATNTPDTGLTSEQARDRLARGLGNDSGQRSSRSLSEILRANIFTRFNAILATMLVIILVVGQIQDATFGLILIFNSLIGITQEVRAKRTLDRLAVLNAPLARVKRDNETQDIAVEDVVLDDLLELRTGDQISADAVVRSVAGLEVDESLLTGESDPVAKAPGDTVMSGSFVNAGAGIAQATGVGANSYASRLAVEARRFKLVQSEIVSSINRLLRWIQFLLIPISALLLWRQLASNSLDEALVGVVAGVIGMVPEGLVLLTSLAFGIATVTLARKKVLVQELPAVEVLARVDTVCFDKTGTLTEGEITFSSIETLSDLSDAAIRTALAALADDVNANATFKAISAACPTPDWVRSSTIAFSSDRKWSAAEFVDHGSWVFGAPEMVITDTTNDARKKADVLAARGDRVLLLASSTSALDSTDAAQLPADLIPVALVVFVEKIRSDAAETLKYFSDQGVDLKVISGDNPRTVAAVARRVGFTDVTDAFDARNLPEDESAIANVLDKYSVFGRVTPHQKRAMVAALQSRGHVVAMTGDGVNDALALKDADLGVAMGSGAAATRAVAQLVLLDSKFSTLPGVMAEGRRVIANIERAANLFVTKTVYAVFIALVVVLTAWRYPFLPRHLTIISTFTIGIPGFFLALGPNTRRYIPGLLDRVMRFCIPAGVVAGAAALTTYAMAYYEESLSLKESRTAAALVLVMIGLWVLVILTRPLNLWKGALVGSMAGGVALVVLVPPLSDFYALEPPGWRMMGIGVLIAVGAIGAIEIGWRASRRWPKKFLNRSAD